MNPFKHIHSLKIEIFTYLSLCPLDWQVDYIQQAIYLFIEAGTE